jgi:hypothetical protein
MPQFWYNDGSGVRLVKEFYYNDGSGVRKIKEGWYNDGSGVRKFYSLGTIVSPFTHWAVEGDTGTGLGTASAILTFKADGTVTGVGAASDMTAAGSGNWITPTTSGIGGSYWIRATQTSGTITGGVVGSWVQLSSDWSWSKNSTTGGASCTLTFEIATDFAGSNIVFTSTGNTLTYAHV